MKIKLIKSTFTRKKRQKRFNRVYNEPSKLSMGMNVLSLKTDLQNCIITNMVFLLIVGLQQIFY